MDQIIEKNFWSPKRWFSLVLVISLVLVSSMYLKNTGNKRIYRVDRDRVTISTVSNGEFEDFILVRGHVSPIRTVYVDAIQGGSVEEKFVEKGELVNAGQPLVKFKNTKFELEVYSQEANISEKLDINSSTRLQLDQNRLDLKRRLNDIQYAVKRLNRKLSRQKKLLDRKLISANEIDALEDELEYQLKQQEITVESIDREESIRDVKIKQLEGNEKRLDAHLQVVRESHKQLLVLSPISGQITALDVELGETKHSGDRLAQIDKMDQQKLKARVDEFYINRLRLGQKAKFELQGNIYFAHIDKIYPEVIKAQFEIDLLFTEASPSEIRRGQTVQLQIAIGGSEQSLLLPVGGFYGDTGGKWVFVVEDDIATKRSVNFGRRNASYIEVVEGLNENDQVLTSSYQNYMAIDQIRFN